MATNDTTASIIALHPAKRAKTAAERAKDYRDRQKAKRLAVEILAPAPRPVTPTLTVTSVTPIRPAVTRRVLPRPKASHVLTLTAFGLAAVGVIMNGWFAHSLGSSDIAGWLFAAIGIAADLVALAVPTCAARLWQTHKRGTAAAGWLVWTATFIFAVIAGIGFASVNISDVTLARASRTTPATESAKAQLTDAMTARDRECAGGVGKNCRAREEAVAERRRNLDVAMQSIVQSADPQTEAASKIVAWLSFGTIRPTGDDFAMLRLILLALLPQVGGILLMIGRNATD